MKGNVRSWRGWLKGRSGNTVILMNVMCLMLLVLTLASLDVFSILASRRYAQTDADAAAVAGVRAIQPIVSQELLSTAQAKIARLVADAVQKWEDNGAKGDELAYVMAELSSTIHNPYVVSYVVGQADTPPDMAQFFDAVLTPQERGCAIRRVAAIAQTAGQTRAEQFMRDPQVETVTVTFPYGDYPWVGVDVRRDIPTVFIRRFLHHTPSIQVLSGATLQGLADLPISACH